MVVGHDARRRANGDSEPVCELRTDDVFVVSPTLLGVASVARVVAHGHLPTTIDADGRKQLGRSARNVHHVRISIPGREPRGQRAHVRD